MSVPIKVVFTRKNDQYVEIDGLQDPTNPDQTVYVNNATVFATLVDQFGNPVAGLNNVELFYLGGSNGDYRGLVEQTFNPKIGVGYTLKISASAPGLGIDNEADMLLEIPAEVVVRVN
jgi:hypothetical protein